MADAVTMGTPVTGVPKLLLRLEGAAALIAALVAYRMVGASWSMFALLFLVPDVSLAGYLAGPRVGSVAYNVMHTYVGPALLAALAWMGVANTWAICLIWIAHNGMDRMFGLGLKFATAFRDTHLGTVGKG